MECVDKYGNTPLHSAAKHGHELLITILLNNAADVARCVFTNPFKHRDYCSRTHTLELCPLPFIVVGMYVDSRSLVWLSQYLIC